MRRREFIAGLGSAAAWPLGARGQQGERMRRVGVLMGFEESNLEAKAFLSAFTQGLAELGWTDRRNLQMDVRWTAANVERALIYAKELVDLQPDVIFVSTDPATDAIQRETRTIPIVFAFANDFDAGLPQPGANITGFLGPQASLADKWLEAAHGDCARCQARRHRVQSQHGSRRWIIFSTLVGGSRPHAQSRADRSARS